MIFINSFTYKIQWQTYYLHPMLHLFFNCCSLATFLFVVNPTNTYFVSIECFPLRTVYQLFSNWHDSIQIDNFQSMNVIHIYNFQSMCAIHIFNLLMTYHRIFNISNTTGCHHWNSWVHPSSDFSGVYVTQLFCINL
jgi:hypothetical protein